MQSTLYRYSEALGLIEKGFEEEVIFDATEWKETPEEAMTSYYLKELSTIHDNISRAEKTLEANKKALENLNEKFGHLKEIYPEEFI